MQVAGEETMLQCLLHSIFYNTSRIEKSSPHYTIPLNLRRIKAYSLGVPVLVDLKLKGKMMRYKRRD